MARHSAVSLLLASVLLAPCSCAQKRQPSPAQPSAVTAITTAQQFTALLDSAGGRLLAFDLYADWCMPCKILSPALEKIAVEHRGTVSFYKINTDKLPQVAQLFQVSGIPYVVFVKNRTAVAALVGVQPAGEYVKVIRQFGSPDSAAGVSDATGEIVGGVRVVRFEAGFAPQDVYVYRGEQVKFVIGSAPFAYSVFIPAFGISQEISRDKETEVTFRADSIGVFRLFCNGDCPSSSGKQEGRIIVMEREEQAKTQFKTIGVREAGQMMAGGKALLLDVRTPKEFFAGYIEGAKLIPLDQLPDRVSEIAPYRNADVIVYCRSGNRSLTASQILLRSGFKRIYNVRGGIVDWQKNQMPVVVGGSEQKL